MLKQTRHAKKRVRDAGLEMSDVEIIIKCGGYTIERRNRKRYSITTSIEKAALLEHLIKTTYTIVSEHIVRLLDSVVIVSKDDWLVTVYRQNVNSNTSLTKNLFMRTPDESYK